MHTPEDDTPPASVPSETFDDLATSVSEENNALQDVDPGLYIVTYTCSTCPCDLTIENTADMVSGDSIFAAIMDAANQVLLSISNEVKVSELIPH